MSAEIITIPCLSDNYAFLMRDTTTGTVALIDAPEAPPILAELKRRGWGLDYILITHHHYDHIDGIPDILAEFTPKIIGAAADAHRLPPLDNAVAEGDMIEIGALTGHIIDVSGHTINHIALYFPDAHAVFTADSLMAMGCGRVFEGTMPQMHDSLQKLAALPPDTMVYSGHEYTASNARFALTVDPDNPALHQRNADITDARANGIATVPSLLALELATNPFLRARDAAEFTEIRTKKDSF